MQRTKTPQRTLNSFLGITPTKNDDDDDTEEAAVKKKRRKNPEPQKATMEKVWDLPTRSKKTTKPPISDNRSWGIPDTVSEIIVISEKTEVPGRYMKWAKLMLQVRRAEYTPAGVVKHFLNEDLSIRVLRKYVSLSPDDVKVLVWWGKDYGPWIKEYEDPKSVVHHYAHFFNFSINADSDGLEKGFASPLQTSLDQLHILANKFGGTAINVRFGPICVYRHIDDDDADRVQDNLTNFESIVEGVSNVGIHEIIATFVGTYPQTVVLMKMRGKVLVSLGAPEKQRILDNMLEICSRYSMTLKLCCEDNVLVGYQGKFGGKTEKACCYDPDKFRALKIYLEDTSPQSETQLCQCVSGIDIGRDDHPCTFSCDYCHSQPTKERCPPERRDMEDFGVVQ